RPDAGRGRRKVRGHGGGLGPTASRCESVMDTSRLFGPGRPRRPNIIARDHVVVSGHYYASLAGFQVLEAGGNAIDAGVATGLAIDVLESEFVGFGGVAPIMVRLADGTVRVVNGVGPWPAAADINVFHAK